MQSCKNTPNVGQRTIRVRIYYVVTVFSRSRVSCTCLSPCLHSLLMLPQPLLFLWSVSSHSSPASIGLRDVTDACTHSALSGRPPATLPTLSEVVVAPAPTRHPDGLPAVCQPKVVIHQQPLPIASAKVTRDGGAKVTAARVSQAVASSSSGDSSSNNSNNSRAVRTQQRDIPRKARSTPGAGSHWPAVTAARANNWCCACRAWRLWPHPRDDDVAIGCRALVAHAMRNVARKEAPLVAAAMRLRDLRSAAAA